MTRVSVVTTLVSSRSTASRAAATARSARGPVCVLDLDGDYRAASAERVLTPEEVGLDAHEVGVRRVLLAVDELERWAQPALLRHVLGSESVALAVTPGVLLLRDASDVVELALKHHVVVFARGGVVDDGLWPGPAEAERLGSHGSALVAVSRDAASFVDTWQRLAPDAGDRWLDVVLGLHAHHVVRDGRVVSAWSVTADTDQALAVDLSSLDISAPWLLDPRATATPRIRLSHDDRLREIVHSFVDEVGVERAPRTMTSVGIPLQPHVAALVTAALAAGQPYDSVPDLFDEASSADLTRWLTEPRSAGMIAPYLAEVYGARPELRAAFPTAAAGRSSALTEWAASVGLAEVATAPAPPAAVTGVRNEGLNVVGYLSGELGVGESARLMLSAIDAGGIPHTTVAVTKHLRSRQKAVYRSASSDQLFDVTLLCVNAKETPSVVSSIAPVAKRSYRIGMWYWETEDFPVAQHRGFRHVDEVWVATDFMRAAIEPHSPVPVRTVMPPLPQPGRTIDQAVARARLGLPERPILLFSFDFASIAERKNPWGLIDAFEQAFAPGEGPVLVIKSISGDRSPAPAERLRLRAGDSPDILLVEDYLDADDRDALMAACDCYVSLHRAEGLGLTMAEAMAFGKPVIATAYGGNMQFMTDENSYLVPFAPIAIPVGSGPYTPGATWAAPDLGAAADAMRTVFADLPLAAARGARAAEDMRARHSPSAAGEVIAARLAEIRAERCGPPVPAPRRGPRAAARRILGR